MLAMYDDISLDVTKEILMQRKRFFETDVQEMLSKYYDQLGKKKYQEGPWYNICKGQWSKFNPLISEIPYEDTVLVDTDGTVSEQLYKLESMENTWKIWMQREMCGRRFKSMPLQFQGERCKNGKMQ